MLGEEGFAWEAALQAEWDNMVKFDIFLSHLLNLPQV
jgi:hypothetical protein